MDKIIWSKENINFLIENYPKYGVKYCCEYLNYNRTQILNKTHKLNLKLDDEIKSQILSKPSHMCNINPDMFLNITRHDIAYLLGFLWSDGFLQKNKTDSCSTIGIKIIEDDMMNIKPIFDKIGKWNTHIRTYKNNPNWKNSYAIFTNNKRIYDFLIENDYDKKSYVSPYKILERIPDELKPSFFLGLSDGDGCFYFYKTKGSSLRQFTLASSYEQDWSYMVKLCNNLDIKYNIKRISKINKKTNKVNSSSVFRVTNKNDIIKYGDFIYSSMIGLNRKYEKYIIIKNS